MHHERPMRLPIITGVFEAKPFRQVEVELYGTELPFPPERIDHLQIDLWAIKGCPAFIQVKRQLSSFQRLAQRLGRHVPIRQLTGKLIRVAGRKISMKIVQAKMTQDMQTEMERPVYFFRHLVGTAKNVRIILSEAAYPQQAMQDARAFITINRTPLGYANRQIPIGAGFVFIDLNMERTIHRFDVVGFVIDLHGRIHVFLIPGQVPARFPQPRPPNVRRISQVVAILNVFLLAIGFSQVAHHSAVRMPEYQPSPNFRINTEQIEILAKLTVISAAGFLDSPQIGIQFLSGVPGGSIDALQHRPGFISAPVSSGDID